MKNILVIGGGCFIGSNFVCYLLTKEAHIKMEILRDDLLPTKLENVE